MKKIFLFFVVALLVGCTDYTDDFNAIDERLDKIEQAVPSIEEQIESISTQLVSLKETDKAIKAQIAELEKSDKATATEIAKLKSKDSELEKSISDLQKYVDTQIKNAKSEAAAAYATIEQYNTIIARLNALQSSTNKLGEELTAKINSEVATLNSKITELEARLKAVEEKVENLLARIQSVTYLPEYSDGIATINHIGNFSEVSLDFKISPKECATELANVWKTSVSCEALYTKTRAASLVAMPVIAFEVDAERGVITVIASGENLSEAFFAGSQEAKIALVISDGNNSITSDYITMVAKEITDEIWYTSTDENIVEPNTVEGWGAKIVSNTYNDGIGIIKFDKPVSIIPYGAFREKRSLKTIILPQNVQNIEDVAFTFCNKLEYFYGKFSSNDNRCLIVDGELKSLSPQISGEYTLPDTVNRLGYTCIAALQNICQIVIPGSVTSFDDSCSITSTTKVTAFKGAYATTDGRSIIKDNILHGVALYNIKTYDVPEGVTEIRRSIFQNASLTSVTMPASTSCLGSQLFNSCNKLSNVYCKAEVPPTVDGNIFYDITTIPNIYVPRESVEAYKTAIWWRKWADNIVGFDF